MLASIVDFFSQTAVLTTLIATIVAISAAFIVPPIIKRQIRVEFNELRSKFPFDILTVEDLSQLSSSNLERLRLSDGEIPYLERLPSDKHSEMMESWLDVLQRPQNPRLLVRGIAGVGKTREMLELLKHLAKETEAKGPLTILIPKADMDVPLETPETLSFRNIVLFINDLHRVGEAIDQEALAHLLPQKADFLSRLARVIDYFERQAQGEGLFRVVATVRSEPGLFDRIDPENSLWQTFSIQDLLPFDKNLTPKIVDTLASYVGITVDPEAYRYFRSRSDGTFQSLIYYLKYERGQGCTTITEEIARLHLVGILVDEWHRQSAQLIQPYPYRKSIFKALDLLSQAGVPFFEEIVVELAARITDKKRPLPWMRRRIRDELPVLEAWLSRNEGLLVCHETTYQGRAEIDSYVKDVISALLRLMASSDLLAKKLFNPVMNLGIRLAGSNQYKHSLQLFEALTERFNTSAFAHYQLASLLYWWGKIDSANSAIERAIQLDPSVPRFYIVKGDIQNDLGDPILAELSYHAALKMLTKYDYETPLALYNLACNYLRFGEKEKEAACYRLVLDINPHYLSARVGVAAWFLRQGDYDQAHEHASLAFQTKPSSYMGMGNLAELYQELGEPTRAVDLLMGVLEALPDKDGTLALMTHRRLAVCYLQMSNVDRAHEEATKGLTIAQTLLSRFNRNIDHLSEVVILNLILSRMDVARRTLQSLFVICPHKGFLVELIQQIQDLKSLGLNATVCDPIIAYINEKIHDLEQPRRIDNRPIRLRSSTLHELIFDDNESEKNLNRLRERALQLQEELQNTEITVEEGGVCVVISAAQEIMTLDVPGVDTTEIIPALNKAIKHSQKRAAEKLQSMGSLLFPDRDNEDNEGPKDVEENNGAATD